MEETTMKQQQYPLTQPKEQPLINPSLQQKQPPSQQRQQQQQQQQQAQQPVLATTAAISRPKVLRISVRPLLFKAGIASLVFAVVLFTLGFAAPAWYGHAGLWMACGKDFCRRMGDRVVIGWFEAVRILEVLALMCFLSSLGVELYQDFLRSPPPQDNKAVEILALAGGVLGVAGVIVFGTVGKSSIEERPPHRQNSEDLSWGFWLTTLGSVLALASVPLLAVSRVRHAASTNQVLVERGVLPSARLATERHVQGAVVSDLHLYPDAFPQMYAAAVPTTPSDSQPAWKVESAAPLPVTSAVSVMPNMSQVPVCYVIVQGQLVPAYNMLTSSAEVTPSGRVMEGGKDGGGRATHSCVPADNV